MNWALFCITILFFSQLSLNAYQPLEPDGLIGVLTARTPLYALKKGAVKFEKRSDGSRAWVLGVNGREEFEQAVIISSVQKPVVVLVYSGISDDAIKMRDVYHGVADMFKNQVHFVTMDLLAKQHDVLENSQIIGQLMTMQNIPRLGLPIVLFFREGDLYAPEHEPAIMLQGFYSKEHLAGFVRNKFFNVEKSIMDAPTQDLTPTPMSTQRTSSPRDNEVGKKPEEKLSLGQRFLNLFKRK